jgi:hypothetical protein
MSTIDLLPTPIPSRDDPVNFDARISALLAALVTFVPEVNTVAAEVSDHAAAAAASAATLTGSADTQASSTSSLTIGLGSKTFDIEEDKTIVATMWVAIVSAADPTDWMAGPVTSYDTGTGELIVSSQRISGSGTATSWVVYGISPMLPDSAPRNLAAGSTVKDQAGADRLIGFLGAPPISITTAHVLSLADVGHTLEIGAGGSITVPLHATTAFNPGDIILLQEVGGSTRSITPAGGVTFRQAGTTNAGTRTLKAYGQAMIRFATTNDLVFNSGDLS